MNAIPESINQRTLVELARAGSISEAIVVAGKGGFGVYVRYGKVVRSLAGVRGKPRFFVSLDTLVPFLKRLGITKFDVDASRFEPGRIRKPRPDRAEAMRKTRTKLRQERLL